MQINNKIPFIAGNWKMNLTIPEAKNLVNEILTRSRDLAEAQLVIIPPFTSLNELQRMLQPSEIRLGAQNMHWEEKGAFTGEISASMLKDAGCSFVIAGHSERRQLFGESSQMVNQKIKAALAQDITPIMCIGETLEERRRNAATKKIDNQIIEGLKGLDAAQAEKVIIAYEPIWAIGTGLTATPDQAQEFHAFIRNKLSEIYGNETASCAIILYGGSVKPDNAYSLLKEKDINGALIGGASLKAASFVEIAKQAVKAYKEKK